MDKIKKNYKIILCIILFLLLFLGYGYFRIFKSYGYVSNTELIRTVVKNTAGFYYDRGGYIQFDSSFMNEEGTVKRSESFSFVEATRDSIKYIDQVGFIYNVFNTGIGLDISSLIGDVTIEKIYSFGQEIYNKIGNEDGRKNVSFNDGEYVVDYYDNYVTRLSGSMGVVEERHYLVMYVKNNDLDVYEREGIFSKLKETLCVGDVLVFNEQVLLYIGDGRLMYASGENYDYILGIDDYEERAIKVIEINELNKIENEMYLYNSQEFYVYRFLNISGYWNKLPSSYLALRSYYSNNVVPNIKIEKFGSKNDGSDVYLDDEIIITLKISNNSDQKIIVPVVSDVIDTSKVEYLSNNYIDEAYLNGKLTFTEIAVEGNGYKEISYRVKVIGNEGDINFDQTKIGNYEINTVSYKIRKRVDFTRLINGDGDVLTNYKRLYNILIDENKFSEVNKQIIVSNLYGGKKITDYNDRAKYINHDKLITGDIILYDDQVVMYVKEMNEEYFVDRSNKRIDEDTDIVLEGLLGKNEYVIIRPSYLYDDTVSKFGDLVVDHGEKIIYISKLCTYSKVIEQLNEDLWVEVRDIDDMVLDINEQVKTGSKIIVGEDEYYISLLGDVNGDGLINTGDVLKLHRYVLGKIETLEKYYLASSDINSDDLINTGDVLKLHRYVLGKIENLE